MSDILDDYEDAMFDRGKIVAYIPLPRLCELATAEREGRVVVLPCRVGDVVWVTRNYSGTKRPVSGIVESINFTKWGNPSIVVYGIGRGTWGERIFSTRFEAESALSSVINQVDRCSTCENNGKSICSSCIMTGHGNDIDFYRAATEPKGEATT